ncbi:MAG: 1-phosphofructokinase [Firmicutes bacterium]|nr:1-phosphofructokinase [Bacillota bacterium]
MIYTVTFNPAVDYVMRAERVVFGETNRSQSEELYFGGKGINVSVVLQRLGLASTALGFVAGFTGAALEQSLSEQGVAVDFVRLPKGFTRINVKLKTGEETEINAQGPEIPPEALQALFERLRALQDGDTLVLAGSIPGSLPQDIYERILEMLSEKKIRFVVDATGELLLRVLPYHPFLIKPNQQELEELAGARLLQEDEIVSAARKLQQLGAQNVLVSRGKDGALLAAQNGTVLRANAAKGVMRNTVGAGDSMVAGFLYGWQQSGDYDYALRCGIAAGGATAFADGLARREDFLRLLAQSGEVR